MAALISDPSFNVRLTRNELRVIGLALSGKLKARDDLAFAADLNRRLLKEQVSLLRNLLTAAEGALGAARNEAEELRPEPALPGGSYGHYLRIQAAYAQLHELLTPGSELDTPEAEALFKSIRDDAEGGYRSAVSLPKCRDAFLEVAKASAEKDLMKLGRTVADLDQCFRELGP